MLSLSSPSPRLGLILPALLVVTAFGASGALAGEETTQDGVLRIVNGSEPADGKVTLELEEVWSAGGEDDEETVFGLINKVLIDDDNNIYLLDAQLSEISVFSPEGELLSTLGREGDGPGEFRGPTDMAFLPDGSIGVLQAFPGKVIKLNLDGTEAGTWPMGDPTKGAFYIMRGLRARGGLVVGGGTEQHINQSEGIVSRETFLSSIDTEGMRDKTYATSTLSFKFQDLKFDEKALIDGVDRRFDVAPDGRVVACIPRNTYEISVYAPDGTLERVFSREYESWVRNERAAGIWQSIMETIQSQQAPNAPVSWEETEPDVEFIRVAPDGRIWVLNSRAMWTETPGAFTYFDVFTADGHFEKQVEVVCEGNPQEDILFFAGDDLAFMVTGFWDAALSQFGGAGAADDDEDAQPMSVICYRVK